jgi:hypothetical protein
LRIYGDLKWHFKNKSSKLDLLNDDSTYKYINISQMEKYIRKKRKWQNKLNENKLSGQGANGDSDRDSDRKMKLLWNLQRKK